MTAERAADRQLRCRWGDHVPSEPDPPPRYLEARAWHDFGRFVVALDDDRLRWPEREQLKQIAERFFGKRQGAQ